MSFTPGPGTTYLLTSTQPIPSGTANGVLYLDGSKVVTSGSALQFSGTALTVNLDGTSLVVGTGGASTTAASFRSTTRNQLRFPSGASFEWHEGVNELMRLNSTGLGIGTSSPGAKLEVAAGTGFPTARFTRVGTAAQTGSADIGMSQLGFPGSTNADTILRSSYGFGLQVNSAGSLVTALVADLSGNIGVGATPSAWSGLAPALQVQRASIITSSASAVDTYFSSNAFYDGNWKYILSAPATQYMQNVSGDHRWRVAPSGTAGNTITFTQAMTLDTSGRLLIGAASSFSSAAKLQVQDNISLETNGTGGKLEFFSYGTARGRISTPATAGHLDVAATSILSFGTAGSERVRITSVGNVGIGTTNPSGKVQIGDTAGASGADFSALVLAGGAASPDSLMALTIEIADTGATGISGKNVLFSGSSSNSDFAFAPSQTLITTPSLILTSEGNVYIGGTADRATTKGKSALQIFNGTAPVGTLANGISIYSDAGEAYVMDAAGNATLFSPHDSETNEWIFRSKHTPTGKVLKIDVERLLRFVNDHFGLDAVREFVEA